MVDHRTVAESSVSSIKNTGLELGVENTEISRLPVCYDLLPDGGSSQRISDLNYEPKFRIAKLVTQYNQLKIWFQVWFLMSLARDPG